MGQDDNRIIPEHQLSFQFKNMSVVIKKASGSTRKIISNVSGEIQPGQLLAVMGPSGSGKSTFLHALCGRAVGDVDGETSINGIAVKLDVVKKLTGFVPQDDILLPTLTPREAMQHSADTRLPALWPAERRAKFVNGLITSLRLDSCQHTVVGNELSKERISGGQRKRANVGIELAARPYALFCDEPTSGLDSATAEELVNGLKDVANTGVAVVAVIHQPRYEIFSKFDVLLLFGTNGQVVYYGPTRDAIAYFERIGLRCPARMNPADFVLDVASGTIPRTTNPACAGWSRMQRVFELTHLYAMPGAAEEPQSPHRRGSVGVPEGFNPAALEGAGAPAGPLVRRGSLNAMVDKAKRASVVLISRAASSALMLVRGSKSASEVLSKEALEAAAPPGSLRQLWSCFVRGVRVLLREPGSLGIAFGLQILSALALSVGFSPLIQGGTDGMFSPPMTPNLVKFCPPFLQADCRKALGTGGIEQMVFFFNMAIGSTSAINAVGTFGSELTVIRREWSTGASLPSLFLGKCAADFLKVLWTSLAFAGVFLFFAHPGDWWRWCLICIGVSWAASGLGYAISCTFRQMSAPVVCIMLAVASAAFNGCVPPLALVNSIPILNWIWACSYTRWASEAVFITYAGRHSALYPASLSMVSYGFDGDNFGIDILLLFILGSTWRIVTYLGLMRVVSSSK